MILVRHCYSDEHTLGRLYAGAHVFCTLERPWRPGAPGGLPFVSCVPDGTYNILPHVRPNGDRVFALRNPDCGVWYTKTNVPDSGGRFLILAHAANYVHEIQGCIAVGMGSAVVDGRTMVTNSRAAMRELMAVVDYQAGLTIRPTKGTAEDGLV